MCYTESYPDEQEGVRLCQQRGQVVLDAERLAHVLPHLGAVLLNPLYHLLSLVFGDVPQSDHQVLHLDLQVRAQLIHLVVILLQRVLKSITTNLWLVAEYERT